MVFETLFSAKSVHRHPLLMMLHAIILSSVGIGMALFSFPQWANLLSLVFVTIGCIPVMETLLKHEEKVEAKHPKFAGTFIARHFNLVQAYAWLFVGLILSYSFWYAALPLEMKTQVFGEQEKTTGSIADLRERLSGMFTVSQEKCGKAAECWFQVIFFNNISVAVSMIFLGLAFGAGAIFLLAWNASIIGTVIGKEIIALAASYQAFGLFGGMLAFLHGLFNGLGLVPHGTFEALGYFLAAIAGGIIGILATKRHYYKHELGTIIKDMAILIAIAAACILIGAVIEAFVIVSSI